jgi:hypothetical protein
MLNKQPKPCSCGRKTILREADGTPKCPMCLTASASREPLYRALDRVPQQNVAAALLRACFDAGQQFC